MNKNKLRQEISHLIDSIKDHSDMITNYRKIPQLELEMILSKIKKLYEKSIVFNYLNEVEQDDEQFLRSEPPEKVDKKPLEQEVVVQKKDKMEGTQLEYVERFEDENIKKSADEPEPDGISRKEPLKNISLQREDINSKLKDRIGNSSLNEKIYDNKTDSTVAGKLEKKKIESLNKAIGTNEKFVFTRELFGNDREAFNQAIKNIDSLSSYEEAEKYIHENIAGKFEWDFNLKSVVTFFDLLKRRFL